MRLEVRADPRPCHPPELAPVSRLEAPGRSRWALWLEPVSRPFSRYGSDSRTASTLPIPVDGGRVIIGNPLSPALQFPQMATTMIGAATPGN